MLYKRSAMNTGRDPLLTKARFFSTVIPAVIMGLVLYVPRATCGVCARACGHGVAKGFGPILSIGARWNGGAWWHVPTPSVVTDFTVSFVRSSLNLDNNQAGVQGKTGTCRHPCGVCALACGLCLCCRSASHSCPTSPAPAPFFCVDVFSLSSVPCPVPCPRTDRVHLLHDVSAALWWQSN